MAVGLLNIVCYIILLPPLLVVGILDGSLMGGVEVWAVSSITLLFTSMYLLAILLVAKFVIDRYIYYRH